MTKNFENAFDDFLNERMGEDVAQLREKNERYRAALTERSELIRKAKAEEIEDYRQAFNRLAELNEYISDIESRYLYYAGMATYKKIGNTVSTFDLLEIFTE